MKRELGVSVFFGMEQSYQQNCEYLERAASLEYRYLFTSLHIPESKVAEVWQQAAKTLEYANSLGFAVTADISPRTLNWLGIQAEHLCEMGVHTVRLDYGFELEQIKKWLTESPFAIELNASTTERCEIDRLLANGLERARFSAGHNYYPRPDTGLSLSLMRERSLPFREQKIPVSAFIPCLEHPRGPIRCGLPTLESHRRIDSVTAAKQIWACGCIDRLYFSDPLVPARTLAEVKEISESSYEPLTLRILLNPGVTAEAAASILGFHRNRLDSAQCVIRSAHSRVAVSDKVLPGTSTARTRGDVTLDNLLYGRYMGEVQIVLQELPRDERVNTIGRIIEADACLLECIGPGQEFVLREVEYEF